MTKYLYGAVALTILALFVGLIYAGNRAALLKAERDLALSAYEKVAEANQTNAETLKRQQAAREDNDRILKQAAKDIQEIRLRGSQTQLVIKEVYRNDPAARSWAAMPIPVGVRDALNRPDAASRR